MSKNTQHIYNALHPASALGRKLHTQCGKLTRIDGIAYVLHQLLVIMQIVYGIELGAQNLTHAVQVV